MTELRKSGWFEAKGQNQVASQKHLQVDSVSMQSDAKMAIDLKLLSKEKDLLDAENELEEIKVDIEKRLGAVDIRRKFLRNKEKQFFAALLTYENLLVQIDVDWIAAIKGINAEHSLQEIKGEEVKEVKCESEVAARKRSILNGFLKKYGPSRTFVLNVINLSEEFEKVKEFADEYACLRQALEVQNDRKLAHDIFIEQLNIWLGQIKFSMVNLGDAFFTTSEVSVAEEMKLGRTHMGIEHMFRLVRKKQVFILKHPGCYMEMLKRIGEFIVDWTDVVGEVKKLIAEQKQQRRLAYESRKS